MMRFFFFFCVCVCVCVCVRARLRACVPSSHAICTRCCFAHCAYQAGRLLEPSQPLGVMAAAADEFIKTFGAINVCIYMLEAGR